MSKDVQREEGCCIDDGTTGFSGDATMGSPVTAVPHGGTTVAYMGVGRESSTDAMRGGARMQCSISSLTFDLMVMGGYIERLGRRGIRNLDPPGDA